MIGDIANNTPGANATEVLRAISDDSRIGAKYLNFGYGYGGPCFPRDNRALGHYAASIGIEPLIPKATDKSNQRHAEVMIERFLKDDLSEVLLLYLVSLIRCFQCRLLVTRYLLLLLFSLV